MYWENSSNLDGVGMVDLPPFVIIFSFHVKIGSIEEDRVPGNSSISHTGNFCLFSVQEI